MASAWQRDWEAEELGVIFRSRPSRPELFPRLATEALSAGVDSPSLILLASEDPARTPEIRSLFLHSLVELGRPFAPFLAAPPSGRRDSLHAAALIGDWRAVVESLLAFREFDELWPESIPLLACSALAAGCESEAVAALAGLGSGLAHTRAELSEEVAPLLVEMGLSPPSRVTALKCLIDSCTERIVDGSLAPARGAHEISTLSDEAWDMRALWDQIAIFVGLASEWEDHPDHRVTLEQQILEEARAFTAKGGLQVSG